MVNLFELYPDDESVDEENSPGVNLLDKYSDENMPGTQEEALELAKKQISAKYPGMPEWLRDAILNHIPKKNSPLLDSAARGMSAVTDYIPSVAGGLLQGASLPIRGVASTIPTDFTQKLANSPDLTNLFSQPTSEGQKSAQEASEFFGALGPLGKMFSALKGASQAAKIPKVLQNATALGGTGYLGTPGDTLDKSIGTASALALGGAGKIASKSAEKIIPFARGLFNESTPEKLIESVQKPHDALYNQANKLYDYVRDNINKRGIKTPIKPEYLDEILEYPSMDSKTHRELVKKAKEGDYEAIHTLQRSLYQKGTKDLGNNDSVIETRGENMLELRNLINEDLHNKLIQGGNIDIAHVLRQAKDIYSNLQNTYYDKLLPKGIGKLVHPRIRLLPENIENLFKQNSVAMKRFLKKHPEVTKHIQGVKDKREAHKMLKNLLIGSAGTGGTVITAKALSDLFS